MDLLGRDHWFHRFGTGNVMLRNLRSCGMVMGPIGGCHWGIGNVK